MYLTQNVSRFTSNDNNGGEWRTVSGVKKAIFKLGRGTDNISIEWCDLETGFKSVPASKFFLNNA